MGIQSEKMFLFLFCLGITGSLAEIPLFGPVERRTCIRERYYFATNALYRNFEKAKRNCDYYKCDIIIKYEAGMEYQMRKHYFDIGHFDSDNLCPQNQEMPYEVIWSTDSSLVGRKRGVQRDFVPTVKPVYTYATRKSANETPSSRTHRVGSHESPKQSQRVISGNQSISGGSGQDPKFDGSICLLKISNTVDVPFRLTVKPAMALKFIRTVLGKTENELPDDSISELHFSIRPYATQNIRFPCLAGFGHSQNIDLVQNGNIVLADETIVWPTDYEIRQDFETFFLLE